MAREIEQKADNIQLYQEAIETTDLGTEKEIKLGEMLELSVKERLIKLLSRSPTTTRMSTYEV